MRERTVGSPSDCERLHEALVVPLHDRPRLPDSAVIDRPDCVRITTPSMRSGGMNEVRLSVLEPVDADRVIDETIAEYRALGLRFKWWVGPDSRPADLGDRLERRGLAGEWVRAMVREASPLGGASAEITVEPVAPEGLALFCRVMAEGWGLPLAEIDRAHREVVPGDGAPYRFFLARYRGEPAGIGAYVAYPRSAFLMSAVVLPRFRGKGIYRALVDARARDAAHRQLPLVTSHAIELTSAALLERLGFESVARLRVYVG